MKITIQGETDGTSTTGDFPLISEWWQTTTATHLQIEKGCKYIIEGMNISGAAVKVTAMLSVNGGTSYFTIADFSLPSAGNLYIDKINIGEISAHENDKVLLKFSWSQTTAAKSYICVTFNVT